MSYSISSSKDSCYPGTTILVNKLGLKSQEALDQAEKIAVTLHSVEIEKEYNGLPLSFNYYCSIHKRLFGDIYEWAGSLRTVEIAKKGTKFCKPEDIFQIGEAMFLRLQKNSYFKYLPRVKYIENISEFYGFQCKNYSCTSYPRGVYQYGMHLERNAGFKRRRNNGYGYRASAAHFC